MKKFDYYIIKQFLYTFGLAISLILVIAVIFDFSEKIDNFIDHQAPTNLIIKKEYYHRILCIERTTIITAHYNIGLLARLGPNFLIF